MKTATITSFLTVVYLTLAAAPAGQYVVDADAGTVFDNMSRLRWQRGFSDGGMPWSGADAYCRTLGLDGVRGWRVPTPFELSTIVSHDRVAPAIDQDAFRDTLSAYFWTSTPVAGRPDNAWVVDFKDGQLSNDLTTGNNRVRCVR